MRLFPKDFFPSAPFGHDEAPERDRIDDEEMFVQPAKRFSSSDFDGEITRKGEVKLKTSLTVRRKEVK